MMSEDVSIDPTTADFTTDAGGGLETRISGTGEVAPPLKAWLTAKAFLFVVDKRGVG